MTINAYLGHTFGMHSDYFYKNTK